MKVYDLTKGNERPRLNTGADDLCRDLDDDCRGVECHLTCWLNAPELGICPFLKGKKYGDKL